MHNRDPIAQSARTSWDQTFPRRLAASSSLSHRLRSPARLDKEHRLSRQRQTAKGITLSTPHLLQAPNVVFETQHLAASAARPSCNCRRHIHQRTRGRRTRLRRLSGEQEFFPPRSSLRLARLCHDPSLSGWCGEARRRLEQLLYSHGRTGSELTSLGSCSLISSQDVVPRRRLSLVQAAAGAAATAAKVRLLYTTVGGASGTDSRTPDSYGPPPGQYGGGGGYGGPPPVSYGSYPGPPPGPPPGQYGSPYGAPPPPGQYGGGGGGGYDAPLGQYGGGGGGYDAGKSAGYESESVSAPVSPLPPSRLDHPKETSHAS